MKTLNTLLVLAIMLVAQTAMSQRTYDIRFVLDTLDCTANTVCYRTEVRSSDGQAWNLAGQNYRIFYAGSTAEYIDGSAMSLLPDSQYLLDQSGIQDAQHVDASDFGFSLGFAEDLSFLNYSIDLMSLGSGGVILPGDGEWVPTSKLCFDVPPEATTDPDICLELVWARMGKTDDYATAFVEVSQWVQTNSTTDALTDVYDDLDSQDTEGACLAIECNPLIEPENNMVACTDGLDNDGDGLIDCQEELCAAFCPSNATSFDISLDLTSVDCASGAACYAVSLKSATDNPFTLGSQEYRLYYNSAVGTYLSGSSELSDQYQIYTLQDGTPVENRNASGLGNLPYEADLGYLSFSIQLNDNATGGDEVIDSAGFTQVAEICFTMNADAINDELVCFEANFAQVGVTDGYDSDLLDIQEWKAANDIATIDPIMLFNLDATRGDDACFNTSCVPQEVGSFCGDGLDNDNDGLIDCADPGCSTFPGCDEVCNSDAPVLSVTGSTSTQCDFVTGPVSITSTGGNNSAGYTTQYVLTDADGNILRVQGTSNFEVSQEGFYNVYAFNYRDDSTITGLEGGGNINSVTAQCFSVSVPSTFTVCTELDPCNYCLGERIVLDPEINNSPDFTNQYLLTNKQGDILDILDEPVLDSLDAGLYLLFPISYETAQEITGLEVGQNIAGIAGCCKEIGEAFVVGVCDQLSPQIFFDLQGCDITQNAVLVVGGVYNSYRWSTGGTQDFITVSATNPATYTVTVTLENGCIGVSSQEITGEEISSIGDFVWEDLSPNGRQDATDPGLNGVTVRLFADFDRNGIPDIPDFPSCTTVTGNHPTTGLPGYYNFNVYQSNYVVEFVSPSGYVPTDQNKGDDAGDSDITPGSGLSPTIAIGKGQTINNVDAGFRTSAAICGAIWEDVDADGRREAGDNGMNDIMVNLYTSAGLLLRSTFSADTLGTPGFYCFEDIPVQDYYVEVILPDGSVLSPPNVGTNDALDSEGTNANGPNTTNLISTNSGQTTSGIDFGFYTGGSICGIVFQDLLDGTDGVYVEGIDSAIANSIVFIIDADTRDTVSSAVTGVDGRYCATNIPVGSYQACYAVNPDRESYVQQNTGDDPLLDSDVSTTTGKTAVIFVSSGETINGINAGIRMDALPIELLSFSGVHDRFSKSNILDWSTALEINNDRFEVERLLNLNGTFESIGTVAGGGNTTSLSQYQFIDKDATMPGNYYYRLRQVDFDGGYDYSNIIALKVGSEKSNISDNKLLIFPNPASKRTQVLVQSDKDLQAQFLLTDIMGRVHKVWNNLSLNVGDNLIKLELENVSPGNYILQHNDGTIIRHVRLQIVE